MMTPVGRLILTRTFPKNQLMRAMSYYMLPGMIGPTVGPLVGGFRAKRLRGQSGLGQMGLRSLFLSTENLWTTQDEFST